MADSMLTGQVGQPLFTLIVRPHLSRYGKKEVFRFLKDRERYLLAIQDVQATGAEGKPISFKASVDTDILQSAIFSGDFGYDVDGIAQLAEEHISSWLSEGQGESLSELTKDEIDKAVKANVHIRMSESDASFRIKYLFMTNINFCAARNGNRS